MIYIGALIHFVSVLILLLIRRKLCSFILFAFWCIIQLPLLTIELTDDYRYLSIESVSILSGYSVIISFLYMLGVIIEPAFYLKNNKRVCIRSPRARMIIRGIMPLVLVSIAGEAFYLYQMSAHGIDIAMLWLYRAVETELGVSFYWRWIGDWVVSLSIAYIAYLLLEHPIRWKKDQVLYALILVIVSLSTLVMHGERWGVLKYILANALVYYLIKREIIRSYWVRIYKKGINNIAKNLIIGTIILLAIVWVIVITYFRSLESGKDPYHGFYQVFLGQYGGLDTASFILSHNSFTMAEGEFPTMLDFIWQPIPRAVWENKPLNLGMRVTHEMGFTSLNFTGGATVPFYAELYRYGGLVLMILGVIFYGGISAYLEYKMLRSSSPWSIIVYSIAFVNLLMLWWMPFADVVSGFIMSLIPIAILYAFSKGARIQGV